MGPDDQLRRDERPRTDWGRCTTWRVDDLRPHPSYARNQLSPTASQLSALVEQDDLGFKEPIWVTRDGVILDGYARWELARKQGRSTLTCIEFELTDTEALQCLIRRHSGFKGVNAFCLILVALDLEPGLQTKARENQQSGGLFKGLQNLAKVLEMHVRTEIAKEVRVSSWQVGKVKFIRRNAIAAIQEAARTDELSIHQAWLLSKEPAHVQQEMLRRRRLEQRLLQSASKHARNRVRQTLQTTDILPQLTPTETDLVLKLLPDVARSGGVCIRAINQPGKRIYVTQGLLAELRAKEGIHADI